MVDFLKVIKAESKRTNPHRIKETSNGISELFMSEEKRGEKIEQQKREKDESNLTIGYEKDNLDLLGDLEKLKMKDLDKMNPKTQNKLLKKEYLKVYDRIEEVGSTINSKDKKIRELQMKGHQSQKELMELRSLVRQAASLIPGKPEMKEMMERSNWNVDAVKEDFLELINNVMKRAKSVDEKVEEATKLMKQKYLKLEKMLVEFETKMIKMEKEKLKTTGEEKNEGTKTLEVQKEETVNTLKSMFDEAEVGKGATDKGKSLDNSEAKGSLEVELGNDDESKLLNSEVEPDKEEVEVGMSYEMLNIDRYMKSLSDEAKYILEVIGSTGVARTTELQNFLKKDPKGKLLFERQGVFVYKNMSSVVKTLRDGQFLKEQAINLGVAGHNFLVFWLDDLGNAAYKKLTGKNPVVSEKKGVMDQHKSLEHGYLIKDCAFAFSEMGYQVFTDKKDLTFKLKDGVEEKIFDLKLISKDGKTMLVEVERGTHKKEFFYKNCNRILELTNEFYFISDNGKTLQRHTRQNFFAWIREEKGGTKELDQDIIVNFAKFEDIKKKAANPWTTMTFEKKQ